MGCAGSKCAYCIEHTSSSNNENNEQNRAPTTNHSKSTSVEQQQQQNLLAKTRNAAGGAAAAVAAALLLQQQQQQQDNTFLLVNTSSSTNTAHTSSSYDTSGSFILLPDNNNKMVAINNNNFPPPQPVTPSTPTTKRISVNQNDSTIQAGRIEELENSTKWLQARLHDADKQINAYKKDLAAVTINFELAQDEICRQRKLLEERDEDIRNLKRIKDVYQSIMRGTGILPSAASNVRTTGGTQQPSVSPMVRSANFEPLSSAHTTAGTNSDMNFNQQNEFRGSKKLLVASNDSPNKGQQMLKRALCDDFYSSSQNQTQAEKIATKLRESFALKLRDSAAVSSAVEKSPMAEKVTTTSAAPLPSTAKDFSTKEMLKKALLKNDLLQEILHTTGPSVTSEIIENMYKRTYARNDSVVVEGEPADALFVLTAGKLEIRKGGKVLGTLEPAKAFGEIGIIYKCTRTASVIAIANDTCVWTLDRQTYQKIIMNAGQTREEELLQIIRHVPLLQTLDEKQLRKVATALDTEYYTKGSYIFRQGEAGDVFFIISSGKIEVLQIRPGLEEPKVIRELERGAFFGEKALLREDKRSASVIAKTDCECLTLEREKFLQLIPAELFGGGADAHNTVNPGAGGTQPKSRKGTQTLILPAGTSLMQHDGQQQSISPSSTVASGLHVYGDDENFFETPEESEAVQKLQATKSVSQIQLISVIGRGGFGKVYLAEPQQLYTSPTGIPEAERKIYALKLLSKRFVISERQFEHIKWEKDILFDMRSPFIVRLYTSFMDAKFIYLLLEICQGGDLFQRLRQCGRFELEEAQFHSACVVSALQYIHNRGICYRDLKPENCVMDGHGYTKLVDFGFAKEVLAGKTYTFCGTPQYLAPELIIGSGHDIAVDYWSFGILMFELSSGCSPFYFAGDIYQLYLDILDGIERVEFPRDIGSAARDLLRRLCRKKPTDRIGYGYNGVKQIKKHKYFQAFDWHGLKSKTLRAPFVPKLNGTYDTSNFRHVKTRADELSEGEVLPPDDFSADWENF